MTDNAIERLRCNNGCRNRKIPDRGGSGKDHQGAGWGDHEDKAAAGDSEGKE